MNNDWLRNKQVCGFGYTDIFLLKNSYARRLDPVGDSAESGSAMYPHRILACCVIVTLFFLITPIIIYAQTAQPAAVSTAVTELQSKIDQRNQDIKNLEQEIVSYQKQLIDLGTQSSSLAATLKTLQLTQKKLEADIKVTEAKIAEKNLLIQQLRSQISDKEDNISDDKRIIGRSFATMNELSTKSLPEMLLTKNSLSDAWNSLDQISSVQRGLSGRINSLRSVKANLESNKRSTEKAKSELLALNNQLKDQRVIVLGTVAEKNALLRETKQSETEYQRILAQRQKEKEAFLTELAGLEASLKAVVDPSSIPTAGKGILGYPVDVVRITQYFGNTEFAANNQQIYGTQGHDGVDFAATIGTRIKSAADGIVIGSGDTDSVCPRVSYGKWILVRHNNGLTTVYGHLSYVTAVTGQSVSRGETIAYSGYSGNVVPAGPRGAHLHFGVFTSDGVTIGTYNFKSCTGASIRMPLLTKRGARLDPMLYL